MGSNIVNGCGACSGFWKFLKPPHYKFFENECNTHDTAYNKGGDFIDRLVADIILFRDMRKLVIKYFHNRKVISRMWFIFLCVLYYLGVRLVGSTNFNYETGNKTLSN